MKGKIILVLIIILAAILRLYALNHNPAGLNADEAAIGYDAYSLLQTGKDEFGKTWPMTFTSFGDYKPGAYFYLTLPFIGLLGLSTWAVRLPSAILGILAVWLVFILASIIQRSSGELDRRFPYIAALLLAISPWHIHFSRGGWEANAATTIMLGGVILFLKSLTKPVLILLAALLFVLSMYTYQSTRLIAPLLVGGLLILNWRKYWPIKAIHWATAMVVVVLLLPLAITILSPTGLSRLAGVGLSADTGPLARVNELRGQHADFRSLPARVLHQRWIAYLFLLGKNYLDHFSGNFLFITGDQVIRSKIPEMGQLYLIEIPLLLLGIWLLIRMKSPLKWVVFLWLAVAPTAAALTYQTPSALRAQNMVIPVSLLIAAGLTWFMSRIERLRNNSYRFALTLLVAVLYVWSVSLYLHEYYVHYPQTYPIAWEYGFQQLAEKLQPIRRNYQRIIITDTYDQPYIELLFFLKYPPPQFQKVAILSPRDQYGFSTVRRFANFEFRPINWTEDKNLSRTLLVGTPQEIPLSAKVMDVVYFPNGQPAFEMVSL